MTPAPSLTELKKLVEMALAADGKNPRREYYRLARHVQILSTPTTIHALISELEAARKLAEAVRKSQWPRAANVREQLAAYDAARGK